jgi:hypothetical protein
VIETMLISACLPASYSTQFSLAPTHRRHLQLRHLSEMCDRSCTPGWQVREVLVAFRGRSYMKYVYLTQGFVVVNRGKH